MQVPMQMCAKGRKKKLALIDHPAQQGCRVHAISTASYSVKLRYINLTGFPEHHYCILLRGFGAAPLLLLQHLPERHYQY